MPKSPFFVALDAVPTLYKKACTCTGDLYLWKRLFKFE